jgi:uncharacterized protein (TIGR02246 family)
MRAAYLQGVLGGVLGLLVSGCSVASSTRTIDLKAEEQSIRQLDDQWNAAVQKKDIDAAVSFYAPDGSAMWPDAPAAKGTGAIRKAWADMFKAPNLQVSFGPEEIKVSQSGDLATDAGWAKVEMDTPQGHVKEDAKYLVVWTKVNGAWKAAYDTFNSNAPVAPTK